MTPIPISEQGPRVALLVGCLVDAFRPDVGFAAIELLEQAGCRVTVPVDQTCCGQPAWNSGDPEGARRLARRMIDMLAGHDHVVLPSGSCAAMIRDYPRLFTDEPENLAIAQDLARRTFELTSFLVDVMDFSAVQARFEGCATYHDSCSGLRQMGIHAQPRRLLSQVRGLKLIEMNDAQTCCGFGGLFSVKYPGISGRMVDTKAGHALASGADVLLGGDLGCLMNVAGRLRHMGSSLRVFHVLEMLTGRTEGPGIGGGG